MLILNRQIHYASPTDRTAENLIRQLRQTVGRILAYRRSLNDIGSSWAPSIAKAALFHRPEEHTIMSSAILKNMPVTTWDPNTPQWLDWLHVWVDGLDHRHYTRHEDVDELERLLKGVLEMEG